MSHEVVPESPLPPPEEIRRQKSASKQTNKEEEGEEEEKEEEEEEEECSREQWKKSPLKNNCFQRIVFTKVASHESFWESYATC